MDNQVRAGAACLWALLLVGPSPAQEAKGQELRPDPIAGEEAWPRPEDAEKVKAAGHVPFTGGYQIDRLDARGRPLRGAVVQGMLLLSRGIVELMVCAEGGKEHESVLRLDCDLQALDLALRMSGFRGGRTPAKLGQPDPEEGTRAVVLIQWMRDGKPVTYHAEDLLIDCRRARTMPRVGWTYVGQWAEVPDPTSSRKKTHRVLAATGTRSVITTWRDPSTLLDCPLEEAVDDTAFAGNDAILPEPGSALLAMIRLPFDEERRRIAQAEKDLK